jgi:hypothetical protein
MPSVELVMQLHPRDQMTRTSMAGGNIGDSKIKGQNWQNIFDLYSAGIFSGISFEMQNGLPSQMYMLAITQGVPVSFQLSITQGVPGSFQVETAKDPSNYEANDDVVPDSIQFATAKDSSNEDTKDSDNNDPSQKYIMPPSSDEDEDEDVTASNKYLKRNPDPSLRYC